MYFPGYSKQIECKFYLTDEGCKFKTTCRFYHYPRKEEEFKRDKLKMLESERYEHILEVKRLNEEDIKNKAEEEERLRQFYLIPCIIEELPKNRRKKVCSTHGEGCKIEEEKRLRQIDSIPCEIRYEETGRGIFKIVCRYHGINCDKQEYKKLLKSCSSIEDTMKANARLSCSWGFVKCYGCEGYECCYKGIIGHVCSNRPIWC